MAAVMPKQYQILSWNKIICWIFMAILAICPSSGGTEDSSHKLEAAFRKYRKQKMLYDEASNRRKNEQQQLLPNDAFLPRFASVHDKSSSADIAGLFSSSSMKQQAASSKGSSKSGSKSKQSSRKQQRSSSAAVNKPCKDGQGKDPMPGVRQDCCCQICPEQFLIELQLLQLSESLEQKTYANFHSWHKAYVALLGTSPAGPADEPTPLSFLEGQPKGGLSVPFGMEQYLAYGAGPCCPVCPQNFVPKKNKKSGLDRVLSFAEVSSTATHSHVDLDAGGPTDDRDMAVFLEAMGQVVPAPTCCNVCLSQLLPPRRYEDVNNMPSTVPDPGKGNGFAGKNTGTGSTKSSSKAKSNQGTVSQCCGFCQESLDPVKWQPINGGAPVQQFPSAGYAGGQMGKDAAKGKAGKSKSGAGLKPPPPVRSPGNHRTYSNKKTGIL